MTKEKAIQAARLKADKSNQIYAIVQSRNGQWGVETADTPLLFIRYPKYEVILPTSRCEAPNPEQENDRFLSKRVRRSK